MNLSNLVRNHLSDNQFDQRHINSITSNDLITKSSTNTYDNNIINDENMILIIENSDKPPKLPSLDELFSSGPFQDDPTPHPPTPANPRLGNFVTPPTSSSSTSLLMPNAKPKLPSISMLLNEPVTSKRLMRSNNNFSNNNFSNNNINHKKRFSALIRSFLIFIKKSKKNDQFNNKLNITSFLLKFKLENYIENYFNYLGFCPITCFYNYSNNRHFIDSRDLFNFNIEFSFRGPNVFLSETGEWLVRGARKIMLKKSYSNSIIVVPVFRYTFKINLTFFKFDKKSDFNLIKFNYYLIKYFKNNLSLLNFKKFRNLTAFGLVLVNIDYAVQVVEL